MQGFSYGVGGCSDAKRELGQLVNGFSVGVDDGVVSGMSVATRFLWVRRGRNVIAASAAVASVLGLVQVSPVAAGPEGSDEIGRPTSDQHAQNQRDSEVQRDNDGGQDAGLERARQLRNERAEESARQSLAESEKAQERAEEKSLLQGLVDAVVPPAYGSELPAPGPGLREPVRYPDPDLTVVNGKQVDYFFPDGSPAGGDVTDSNGVTSHFDALGNPTGTTTPDGHMTHMHGPDGKYQGSGVVTRLDSDGNLVSSRLDVITDMAESQAGDLFRPEDIVGTSRSGGPDGGTDMVVSKTDVEDSEPVVGSEQRPAVETAEVVEVVGNGGDKNEGTGSVANADQLPEVQLGDAGDVDDQLVYAPAVQLGAGDRSGAAKVPTINNDRPDGGSILNPVTGDFERQMAASFGFDVDPFAATRNFVPQINVQLADASGIISPFATIKPETAEATASSASAEPDSDERTGNDKPSEPTEQSANIEADIEGNTDSKQENSGQENSETQDYQRIRWWGLPNRMEDKPQGLTLTEQPIDDDLSRPAPNAPTAKEDPADKAMDQLGEAQSPPTELETKSATQIDRDYPDIDPEVRRLAAKLENVPKGLENATPDLLRAFLENTRYKAPKMGETDWNQTFEILPGGQGLAALLVDGDGDPIRSIEFKLDASGGSTLTEKGETEDKMLKGQIDTETWDNQGNVIERTTTDPEGETETTTWPDESTRLLVVKDGEKFLRSSSTSRPQEGVLVTKNLDENGLVIDGEMEYWGDRKDIKATFDTPIHDDRDPHIVAETDASDMETSRLVTYRVHHNNGENTMSVEERQDGGQLTGLAIRYQTSEEGRVAIQKDASGAVTFRQSIRDDADGIPTTTTFENSKTTIVKTDFDPTTGVGVVRTTDDHNNWLSTVRFSSQTGTLDKLIENLDEYDNLIDSTEGPWEIQPPLKLAPDPV